MHLELYGDVSVFQMAQANKIRLLLHCRLKWIWKLKSWHLDLVFKFMTPITYQTRVRAVAHILTRWVTSWDYGVLFALPRQESTSDRTCNLLLRIDSSPFQHENTAIA